MDEARCGQTLANGIHNPKLASWFGFQFSRLTLQTSLAKKHGDQVCQMFIVEIFFGVLVGMYGALNLRFNPNHNDATEMETFLFVILPTLATQIPLFWGNAYLAEKTSADFLEERSPGLAMKDSVRANWSNSAITNALIMSLCIALMVEAQDDRSVMTKMFIMLNFSGAGACLFGLILACLGLFYSEPLSDPALSRLLHEEVNLTSMSMTVIFVGIHDGCAAMTLWVFQRCGIACGLTCALFLPISLSPPMSRWVTLSRWMNPEVPDEVRLKRRCMGKVMSFQNDDEEACIASASPWNTSRSCSISTPFNSDPVQPRVVHVAPQPKDASVGYLRCS